MALTDKEKSGAASGSMGLPFALIGGIGNMLMQRKAGKMMDKAEGKYRGVMDDYIQGYGADVEGLLAGDAFRNYLDTAQAQSMLEQARKQLTGQAEQIRGGIARSGGTAESAIASQTASNQGLADIITRMAGHGTQFNQSGRQRLFEGRRSAGQARGQYAANLYSMAGDKAQGMVNAGKGFSSAMTGIGEGLSANSDLLMKVLGVGI